ncbi:MAG: DUF4145 domain-containing protein [Gammaproteobacteria bacterium]|nr:DUF4145 domain-containing protein [Gammaproteobacteria bacterium]
MTVEKIKANCPDCGGQINADIVAKYEFKDEDGDDYNCVWMLYRHRILKCCGCETVYHQTISVFSEDINKYYHPITGEVEENYYEDISYWPSPIRRKKPIWIHKIKISNEPLYNILQEIYVAFNSDLKILTATGIRTAFDASTEALGIDTAQSFQKKLDDLLLKGKIGIDEKRVLDILTDAGGAAAHRSWSPTEPELHTMINIVEQFIYRNLILTDKAEALKERIPPRQQRKKAVKK